MAFEEFFMPFQFIFMQKAFLIAIILSFPTAILSVPNSCCFPPYLPITCGSSITHFI